MKTTRALALTLAALPILAATPALAQTGPTLPAAAANGQAALRNPQATSNLVASTGSRPIPRKQTLTGFNGDNVVITANARIDSAGTVRVVDARFTLVVAESGQVDRALGFADVTQEIQTRNGRVVRQLGEVGIGGAQGTLFRFGDLVPKEGAKLVGTLKVRGVTKPFTISFA